MNKTTINSPEKTIFCKKCVESSKRFDPGTLQYQRMLLCIKTLLDSLKATALS